MMGCYLQSNLTDTLCHLNGSNVKSSPLYVLLAQQGTASYNMYQLITITNQEPL